MQTTKNLAKSISCEVLADVWWMLRASFICLISFDYRYFVTSKITIFNIHKLG